MDIAVLLKPFFMEAEAVLDTAVRVEQTLEEMEQLLGIHPLQPCKLTLAVAVAAD